MSLAGDLREIAFAELVQLCCKVKRSGALALHRVGEDEAAGLFHFERGELVDASFDDLHGADAVYRALQLSEGKFRFDLEVVSGVRRIHVPVSALLVEGIRRLEPSGSDLPLPPGDAVPSGHAIDLPGHDRPAGAVSADPPPPAPSPDHRARTLPAPAAVAGRRQGASSERRNPSWMWMAALGTATAVFVAVPAITADSTARPVAAHGIAMSPAPAAVAPPVAAPVEARPPAPPPPPAAQPPALTPAVQGVTAAEVVLGMAGPFSGPGRELGRQMKLGVEAAFAAINATGGVQGRKLRLVAADDGSEPGRTASAMKALYEQHRVFAVIGNVGTATAAVALPFALERKMLFFGAFTGAPLLRASPPDRYVFNYRASDAEETAAVVRYLVKVRHLRPGQIAVMAQQDAFGDSGFAGVVKALRGLGFPSQVMRVGYPRNTVDVDAAVARLRWFRRNLRAVVMVATYRAAARFIEKMRESSPRLMFTNVSSVGSSELAEELRLVNPRLAAGVIVTQVVPPVDSYATAVLKYKEALGSVAPGESPDYVSFEGYLDANLLAEGLRRAGRDLDGEKVVDALEDLRAFDLGVGTPVALGAHEHQGLHRVWGTILDEKGRYQALDLE